MPLQVRDQPFAHAAAQVPAQRRIGRTDQRAQLHRALGGVGDLQHLHAAVPFGRGVDEPRKLLAQRRERGPVVDRQIHRADDLGTAARPVRKRVFDDPLQRHDEAPLVPQPHRHERAGDFLDAAPLALDHDHVVEPDRLRQRDLQPGDQIAEHRPRGDTGDQARDAGRREQARADLPHVRKRHQRGAGADDHDQHHHGPHQHLRLRMDAPRVQVVGGIDRMRLDDRVADAGRKPHQQPGQRDDRADRRGRAHPAHERHAVVGLQPQEFERKQRKDDERRLVDVAQHHAHQRIRLRDPLDDARTETMHDRDDQHDDDRHEQRAEP
ncbi:hypothetical protein FEQ04_03196 [Burkholderia pseudomultivorans]|nr:hypothetical protein [Burkholderia pseudomultivorans]